MTCASNIHAPVSSTPQMKHLVHRPSGFMCHLWLGECCTDEAQHRQITELDDAHGIAFPLPASVI